jgi:hypothetical protein
MPRNYRFGIHGDVLVISSSASPGTMRDGRGKITLAFSSPGPSLRLAPQPAPDYRYRLNDL